MNWRTVALMAVRHDLRQWLRDIRRQRAAGNQWIPETVASGMNAGLIVGSGVVLFRHGVRYALLLLLLGAVAIGAIHLTAAVGQVMVVRRRGLKASVANQSLQTDGRTDRRPSESPMRSDRPSPLHPHRRLRRR